MKKNILYALLSNIVTAFFAWLMLWYLIRFGDSEDVGIYGLAQAVALPLYMFFTFKLRTIQVTDILNKYNNNEYLGGRIVLATLNLVVASIVFSIFYEDEIVLAIIALSFSYSLAIIREYYISLVQINERNDLLFISNLVQSIFGFFIFIFIYYLSSNIIYAIVGFSLSRIPSILVDNYFTKIFNNAKYDLALKNIFIKNSSIMQLLKVSMPLGITAVISATFTSIPRIILEKFESLETLGLLTTLMSLIVAINLFMSSFTQAILPKLSRAYQNNLKLFNKISIFSFLILVLVAFLGLFFIYIYSQNILRIVFGEKYSSYSHEFLLCMISGVFLAGFHYSNMLLNSIRYFDKQIYIYMCSALICLISALILIPIYRLEGAIYASMICSLFGFLMSILIFLYKTRSHVSDKH